MRSPQYRTLRLLAITLCSFALLLASLPVAAEASRGGWQPAPAAVQAEVQLLGEVELLLRRADGPPSPIDAQSTPAGWTNVDSFGVTWTNPVHPDGIDGVWYKLNTAPTAADDGAFVAGEGIDNLTGISVGSDGIHTLWLWLSDSLGQADHNSAATVTLRLDTQPPGPPQTVPQIAPTGWQTATNVSYTITWQNPADLSGIAAGCYKLGSEPAHDQDGICVEGQNITQITGVTPPDLGTYHLFLWLRDAADNADRNSRQVALNAIRWDPAPPQIFIDPFGPPGQNGWYLGPVAITLIASDIGSGLDEVAYNLDGAGWVEGRELSIEDDGFHTLHARAIDMAGNHTEIGPAPFNIDSVPPHTNLAFSRLPVYEDWYDGALTVVFTPQDATSGADYVEWQMDGGAWQRSNVAIVDGEGEHTLMVRSVDLAGNEETPQELQVNIDRAPPVTSYVILPSDTHNGWHNEPVTVTLVPHDEGSGVAATFYRVNSGDWITGTSLALLTSGEYTVEFYSVDNVGHAEPAYRIPGGIRIDTEPPRAPTPLDVQPQGWTKVNDFELTMAMPPDLSGIAGIYYKVGEPPVSPTDGAFQPGSASILRDVLTPGEGAFRAFVWLQDVAGNVDHTRHAIWEGQRSLMFDGTPPQTTALLDGTPGENEWFTSEVEVRLAAADAHSGVTETYVSINGGDFVTTTQFLLTEPDKHTLRFYSIDNAGNVEEEQFVTVRIDPDPPGGPRMLLTSPQGWTKTNSFSLVWSNPPDTSGIAAAYYKLGAAPEHERDGIAVSPVGVATGITAPAEGAWDLHFWLMDHAGNADLDTRIVRPGALRYDSTPPLTRATIVSGDLAASGWYTSAVTLQLAASDAGSGVDMLRHRINAGEWVTAENSNTLTLNHSGQFLVEFQAIDVAGNAEALRQMNFQLDLAAPFAWFNPIQRYQRQTSFLVSWDAADEPDGSGLHGFHIQVKDGRNGAWATWGSPNVPDKEGRYFGNFGRRYFFRLRARDLAGNMSPWVELPWGVYVDRLVNGTFAGNSFNGWQHSGPLLRSVITVPGPHGNSITAALLGSPTYGPNVPGMDIPVGSAGNIPIGPATISQTLRIPGTDVLDHPTLTLWYRIFTYDTAFGGTQQRWFDTFDIRLVGPGGEWLARRDGLPYERWQEGVLADLGWRYASLPLPASYAGETVTIHLENWNREDGRLNTWTHVADVRVWEPNLIFLPHMAGPYFGAGASDLSAVPIQADAAVQSPEQTPEFAPASGLR